MPIYEYYCADCNTIFQFLIRGSSGTEIDTPVCPSCGTGLKRVMSNFSVASSSTSPDDVGDDPMLAGLDEEDPRAMAGAIRRMADQMGEELEPDMLEALTRLESGEDPESIEKDLADAGYTDTSSSSSPYRDPGLYTP